MGFKEFIFAVFNTWVEKVGLILTLLPFIEKIPRIKVWLGDKSFIERFATLIWMVGVVCIVWGFYAAWQDQYRRRTEAEDKLRKIEMDNTPQLVGEIRVVEIASWPGSLSDSIIIVDARIKNVGAPSFVDSFIVTINLSNKAIQGLQIPASTEGIISRHPGGGESVLHAADYLPKKGLETISKYGAIEGFYLVKIPDVSPRELIDGKVMVVLSYKDATGKTYTIEKTATGGSSLAFPPPARE